MIDSGIPIGGNSSVSFSNLSMDLTDEDDSETDKRPTTRPGMLSMEARSKYDAWSMTQSMTKQEARDEYVKLAAELVGAPVKEALEADS